MLEAETKENTLAEFDYSLSTEEQNKVRSFSMYEVLEKPLLDYLNEGDGIHALAVFEEEYFPDVPMIDMTLVGLIKFISTAYGRTSLAQGFKIVELIHRDHPRKKALRFRTRHPLYTDGTPRYQNVCLVSGMVHLGIPILPYFDGMNVIDDRNNDDEYLTLLRPENSDLI